MVNNGVLQMQGGNQNATYNLSEQPESDDVVLMSHTQEPSSISSQNETVNFTQDGDREVAHGSSVSESNNTDINTSKYINTYIYTQYIHQTYTNTITTVAVMF